jgi:DDE superfamily endonuclease
MPTSSSANVHLNILKAFRQTAYESGLGHARDALFELGDAVLLAPALNSFAELSLSPIFRRRWPSLYEALQDGRPDRSTLLDLYLAQMAHTPRPLLAGDHTAWPRVSAYTLRERTLEHQPTKVPGAKPITVGEGFSTVVWVPELHGSWALPLLHERITSVESPIPKIVAELTEVCQRLRERPIVLLDSEYGCAPFVNQSADLACDKIVRLRPNRCLWGVPPPYKGKGRYPQHGAKFKLKEPTTWPVPDETLTIEDPQLGCVQLSVWRGWHFKKAGAHPFLVLRLERPHARGTRRDPKDLWVAWIGNPPPPVVEWWWMYLRRFAVDHWYRFAKGPLHWTLPHLKTPEQAERWSAVMPFLTWELWLARSVVADKPLPWQKAQTVLTPGRVRQGMGGILAQIGTPTGAPKRRGKAPGWTKGRARASVPRYPIAKKSSLKAD